MTITIDPVAADFIAGWIVGSIVAPIALHYGEACWHRWRRGYWR